MAGKKNIPIKCFAVLIIVIVCLLVLEGMGQVLFRIRHNYWLLGHDDKAYITLFQKHPYLVVEPRPSSRYVSKDGVLFSHNKLGMRGKDVDVLKKHGFKRILVMGGSSTYCVGVSDNQTWPYFLQEKLGTGYEVLNSGVPGYTTVEHLIQTALNMHDVSPDICIYYIGWNDIRNQHVADLRSDYSNFHGKSQYNHLLLNALKIGNHSVICRTAANMLNKVFVREPEGTFTVKGSTDKFTANVDKRALALFKRNVKLLISLCREQGIRSVIVPQVMRFDMLTGDKKYDWIPYVKDKDIKIFVGVYNDALREVCTAEKADFVEDVLKTNYEKSHFVDDYGHFSPTGNERFADAISKYLKNHP